MAKSDLLKEAIADAKAVKETALANAKIALQEAFAPRIQNMLSAKLSEDLDEADIDDIDDMEQPESDTIEDIDNQNMGAPDGMNDVGDVTLDMDGDGETDFTGDIYTAAEEDEDADNMESPPVDTNPEGEYDEEDVVEGLDEIIAELEETQYMEEEQPDDVTMADGEVDATQFKDGEEEIAAMESIDEIIESILDEEKEDKEETNEMQMGTESTDSKGAELIEALDALEESYKTVHHLKSVINEVNLLNAKLLYTNKLFRSFELTEPQKMKVIENFDRATTTRETKLVFTTLAESFNKPAKKRVVKESYASRPSTTTAPSKKFKQNTQILSEGFEHANRWKKLAGLI